MTVKHTPGPWWEFRNICGADRTVVCSINNPAGGDFATAQANARLIAAAPDLLAACETSLELLTARLDLADICDDEKHLLSTLRATLAQVKGGQPG